MKCFEDNRNRIINTVSDREERCFGKGVRKGLRRWYLSTDVTDENEPNKLRSGARIFQREQVERLEKNRPDMFQEQKATQCDWNTGEKRKPGEKGGAL